MERAGFLETVQQSALFQNLSPPMQTALFLSALVLLPSALVCLTGFTRIVIVLSFVRRAVTSQDIPPNMVVTGLALMLTLFVMTPTWEEMNRKAVSPYLDGKMPGAEAYQQGISVVKSFMLKQTRRQDLALFLHMARVEPPEDADQTPIHVLV